MSLDFASPSHARVEPHKPILDATPATAILYTVPKILRLETSASLIGPAVPQGNRSSLRPVGLAPLRLPLHSQQPWLYLWIPMLLAFCSEH